MKDKTFHVYALSTRELVREIIDIILPTDWDWTLGISVYTPRCARSEFFPWIRRGSAWLQYYLIQKLPESKAFCNEITLCLHTDYSLNHIRIIEQ